MMMKLGRTLAAILLPVLAGYGSSRSNAADESMEPPLIYFVKVGNETATLVEGQPSRINGLFTNPTVAITPDSSRVFPYQGVKFRYPKTFTFEADVDDPSSKTWVLSGSDIKITYSVYQATFSTKDLADSTLDALGRENSEIVDAQAKISLGQEKLAGTSLRTTLAGHKMQIDIYKVPSRDSETRILMFQDSLDELGNRSEEGRRVLAEIGSSFSIVR